MIAARNGWCLSYDNVSTVPPWLSDTLCRVATRSGFGTRRLFTDDEEEIFEACRPIVLNGIEELATRGDLIDRSIPIVLFKIEDENRRDEESFFAAFHEARPRVLGALLDALVTGLRRLPDVAPDSLPRMADFARLGIAAESALGCSDGEFLTTYRMNREGALASALDSSLFAKHFQKFARRCSESFEGTASDLLDAVNLAIDERIRKRKEWPKAANTLSGLLRRLAPSLRRVGIDIDFLHEPGTKGRKLIRFCVQEIDAIDADRRNDPNASMGVDCVDDLQTESADGDGSDWDEG